MGSIQCNFSQCSKWILKSNRIQFSIHQDSSPTIPSWSSMIIYDNQWCLWSSIQLTPIHPSHPQPSPVIAQEDPAAKTHLLFRPKGELQQTPSIPQQIRLVKKGTVMIWWWVVVGVCHHPIKQFETATLCLSENVWLVTTIQPPTLQPLPTQEWLRVHIASGRPTWPWETTWSMASGVAPSLQDSTKRKPQRWSHSSRGCQK